MNSDGQPVLYAVVTGSPAARDVGKLVTLAQQDGWDVCVIASPDGVRFIDREALSRQTGHNVRSTYKDPSAPDELPPADGGRDHTELLEQVIADSAWYLVPAAAHGRREHRRYPWPAARDVPPGAGPAATRSDPPLP